MNPIGAQPLPLRQLAAAAAAVITVAAVVAGQMAGMGVGGGFVGLTAGIAVPFTILGVLVLMSVPRHPVGRLMIAAGLAATVSLVGFSWVRFMPLGWLGQWTWVASIGLIFLAILLFPDGHLPSARWRPVAVVIVVGTAVGMAGLAVAVAIEPAFLLPDRPVNLDPWAARLARIGLIATMVAVVAYLGSLWSLVYRWWHADGDTRRQLMCLLPACVAFLVALTLETLGVEGAWALTAGAVPLGMAVAILRYRLYDVDLLVNRTIVWFLMTALVVLGVIAIVRILSGVLPLERDGAGLLATGVAVVTFEPLHRKVQRGVNRLLYGDRDDPYLVIARLGEVLGRTVDPTAVMPLVTGTIAQSLQVPYVAVELQERRGPALVAEHGRPLTMTESFDMVSHGERIGRLLVARRSTGSSFSRHECRLLRHVAQQAAVAAEATRLNRELQTSRERLVTAREEERRRLRRDLHDGLGPSLAGMSMQVRAARRLLSGDSRAAEILDALATDLKSCTAEVRELVDELRPPALDRGLETALRAECDRFDRTGLSVHCVVDGTLEALPAAVEVAAFRIVAEALTNMARHSRAQTCRVAVQRNGVLRVEIVDDGIGIPASARLGVGLHSMRERAAELGG
ncbi:MAG TPA: histidine kinase, partial [Pseudonocardiaceae bacterium]|nr:histidine kinase [Pseudonocardiaceae bacterium]